MKRHIPNALTIGNLLSGMGGLYLCLAMGELYAAAWCLVLAALFDVADGAVARWLNVSSPIGKDLDSLADGVTFGVLPAMLMVSVQTSQNSELTWLNIVPAALGVCAVLRLAKFNNDPSQAKHFSGVPTPAAALALIGLAMQEANAPGQPHLMTSPLAIALISTAVSALMVSPLPLLSFKLGIKKTWPYWLVISAIALASLPLVEGGFTVVGLAAYVLVSQLYFRRIEN